MSVVTWRSRLSHRLWPPRWPSDLWPRGCSWQRPGQPGPQGRSSSSTPGSQSTQRRWAGPLWGKGSDIIPYATVPTYYLTRWVDLPGGGASKTPPTSNRLLSSVVAPGSRKGSPPGGSSRWSTPETLQLIPQPGTAWKSWHRPSTSTPSSWWSQGEVLVSVLYLGIYFPDHFGFSTFCFLRCKYILVTFVLKHFSKIQILFKLIRLRSYLML